MKKSEVRIMQQALGAAGLYTGETDGKRGPKTNAAIKKALTAESALLGQGWESWNDHRKAVAYLQLVCQKENLDVGPIDGFYGPQTENAASVLVMRRKTGTVARPFGDIVPIIANPHQFPVERKDALIAYYGEPCQMKLERVTCPWPLRLDWDLSTTVTKISIHEKLKDSLAGILEAAYNHYGIDGIKKHGLDRYGGSYNCRKKRGGSSSWSTHSWGIAVDWFPSRNKLRWHCEQASLAHPELDFWWELWEKEGWISLGRSQDRDWMHVQAAKC